MMRERDQRWKVGRWVRLPVLALGVLCAVGAHAAEPPPWDALIARAHAAFDAGPGAAPAARAAGVREAARRVPGDVDQLDVGVGWGVPVAGPSSHEAEGEVALGWRLGGVAAARTRALDRGADASDAALAEARWQFTRKVLARYVRWWRASAVAAMSDAQREALDELLAPVREAAAARTLTGLVASDLEVELARVTVASARAGADARVALGSLEALIGRYEVPPPDAAAAAPATAADPWAALADALDAHPALAALDARAHAHAAEASAAETQGAPTLRLGVATTHETAGSTRLGPTVGLTVPLSNPEAPEVARQRAAGLAARLEREWRRVALDRALALESARWEADRSHAASLEEALLPALRERAELVAEALLAGRATLDELVRVRRDLLEAEHQHAAAIAALVGHEGEARALASLLSASVEEVRR